MTPRWLPLLLLSACRPEAPTIDPLDYLSVGVDPSVDARHEERSLALRGYRVEARVDGAGYVALGAMTVGRERSVVRVITRRGIALGIDAPIRDRPTWRSVELLEGPSGRDLDGDGSPELLVRLRDSQRFAPCLVLLRVRDVGDAFEVPVDTRAHGERACAEGLVDVERDGSPELLVGHRPWFVPGAPVPVVEVPYSAHAGTFVPADDAVLAAYAPEAVAARIEARHHAVIESDARERTRLSVEIAWYERRRGESVSAVFTRLDDALRGVDLDEPTSRMLGLARADLGRLALSPSAPAAAAPVVSSPAPDSSR